MLQRLVIKGYDPAFLVVQSDHCPRDSKLPSLEYISDKILSLTYSQDRVSSRNKVHQSKMKEMIETITASHFMLPLTQIDPDINDKIKRSLQSTDYKDEKHVFNDLTALISCDDKQMNLTLDILLGDETETRRIVFNREDIKISVQEIITKISSIALAVSFEEQLRQNPLSARIFKALKDRFPNVSKETLKAKACKISLCKDEKDWKRMVKELIQENENKAHGALFQKYSFFPSGKTQPRSEEFFHQYVAAFHFYRMLFKWTQRGAAIPVPLRKVNIKDLLNFHCFVSIRNSFRWPTPMMQSPALTL